MKTINAYPPNYELIKLAMPATPDDAIFCYGNTIYNPSGRDIPPDQEFHEEIHGKKQLEIGVDNWWFLYLEDPAFRLSEELEAYGEQYAFACKHINAAAEIASDEGKVLAAGKTKLLAYALDSMARALSGPEYGTLVTYGEASSKIRNYAKERQTS